MLTACAVQVSKSQAGCDQFIHFGHVEPLPGGPKTSCEPPLSALWLKKREPLRFWSGKVPVAEEEAGGFHDLKIIPDDSSRHFFLELLVAGSGAALCL